MKETIFKQNKYSMWYYNIIDNRKKNVLSENLYYEKHHIIPKSLGGSNEKENLVKLLPREHFLVHWIIIKMCTSKTQEIKMKHALTRMMDRNDITEAHNWSKWQYEIGAKTRSQVMTDRAKIGKSPNQNKKHTMETKEKMRIKKLGVKRNPEVIGYLKTRKHSTETKEKISNGLKGRIFSEDSRRKSSECQKGRPAEIVCCPHCEKTGGKPIMMRYHFNNCKKITQDNF